jgi:DnaJ-class molecular chaperone
MTNTDTAVRTYRVEFSIYGPNQTRTRSGCEACEGTGLVYQDNPERPGYLLADECGACQGLGEL